MRTVAVNLGISSLSPKRSLPTQVQFRHFFTSKPRKRSYEGNDRFLPVAAGTAAVAVSRIKIGSTRFWPIAGVRGWQLPGNKKIFNAKIP